VSEFWAMEAETAAAPPSRVRQLRSVPALDGVRGVAILLVVVSHLRVLDIFGITGIAFVDNLMRGGWLGVDLFFVLSGFLITALLLDEQASNGRVRFGAFYGRRALRLLPALYVMLLAHAIYTLATSLPWRPEFLTIRSSIFYVFNWQAVDDPSSVAPGLGLLWSLSIEEQFYLVWPAILLGLLGLRRRASTVAAVLLTAIALIAIHRAILWEHGLDWANALIRTDTHADGLLVGALLASLWVRGRTPTRGVAAGAWLGTAVLIACQEWTTPDKSFVPMGGYTLIAVAAALIVLGAVDGRWAGTRVLEWAPLRLLGRVSYGVYLWHLPVIIAVDRYGATWGPRKRIVVALAITALATTLSWVLIERPALRLKKRLERRPEVAPAAGC